MPALGPPMSPTLNFTVNGNLYCTVTCTPITAAAPRTPWSRPGPSRLRPSRRMVRVRVLPAGCALMSEVRPDWLVTGLPSTAVITSPAFSTPVGREARLGPHHDHLRLVGDVQLGQRRGGRVLLRAGHLLGVLLLGLLLGLARGEQLRFGHDRLVRVQPGGQRGEHVDVDAGAAPVAHRHHVQVPGSRIRGVAGDGDERLPGGVLAQRVQRRPGPEDDVGHRDQHGDGERRDHADRGDQQRQGASRHSRRLRANPAVMACRPTRWCRR